MRHVRVTPGHLAGTVGVRLAHGRAEVTYDLTALSEDAEPELDDFAVGYDDFMAEWERAIAAADEG